MGSMATKALRIVLAGRVRRVRRTGLRKRKFQVPMAWRGWKCGMRTRRCRMEAEGREGEVVGEVVGAAANAVQRLGQVDCRVGHRACRGGPGSPSKVVSYGPSTSPAKKQTR